MSASCSSELRKEWIPSRFNSHSFDEDGSLILFNSLTGNFALIPPSYAAEVETNLKAEIVPFPSGPLAELALSGFFIPADRDELRVAERIHARLFAVDKMLQLILMPNENCNFRCRYCYETFVRNKMKRSVIDGIVKLVERRIRRLRLLRVGWFGGEPLSAPDIIEEISSRLQALSVTHDVDYASSITTNGYLLTPKVAEMLFRAKVQKFQITLDGVKEDHDRLRVLADHRTGTFDRILKNLKTMQGFAQAFKVVIRVNFTPQSARNIDSFLALLAKELKGDRRFSVDFHPVGKWGGPNDADLDVYSPAEGRQCVYGLAQKAVEQGFEPASFRARMEPFGSVCYAANPTSFVVGSDGRLYKCTVAFEDPRNQVGWLTEEGDLDVDEDKQALWVSSGEEKDSGCRACSFRPACQGNACPLARMNAGGRAPCPSIKLNMDKTLRTIARERRESMPPQ